MRPGRARPRRWPRHWHPAPRPAPPPPHPNLPQWGFQRECCAPFANVLQRVFPPGTATRPHRCTPIPRSTRTKPPEGPATTAQFEARARHPHRSRRPPHRIALRPVAPREVTSAFEGNGTGPAARPGLDSPGGRPPPALAKTSPRYCPDWLRGSNGAHPHRVPPAPGRGGSLNRYLPALPTALFASIAVAPKSGRPRRAPASADWGPRPGLSRQVPPPMIHKAAQQLPSRVLLQVAGPRGLGWKVEVSTPRHR